MSVESDVLASVVLGIAGFFIPGICKSVIVRAKHMTVRARECRDAFLFDSFLDPAGMMRWVTRPDVMPPAQQEKCGHYSYRLIVPVTLALLAQAALILLQLATTRELVSTVGTQGMGVTMDPTAVVERFALPTGGGSVMTRKSRCDPTPTGPESLSSITTCYDTLFVPIIISDFSGDVYRLRIVRIFAQTGARDMVLLTVQLFSGVFVRQVQVTPRILSRNSEAHVSVLEQNVEANNRAIVELAERTLFFDDDCSRFPLSGSPTVSWLTPYQGNWDTKVNCNGGRYVLGNNPETSARFNTFAGLLAESFQVNLDATSESDNTSYNNATSSSFSNYYADTADASIAVQALSQIPIEWHTTTERVLSDGVIFAILGIVVGIKIVLDLLLGEDADYKMAFLIHELTASKPLHPTILGVEGELDYEKNDGYIVKTEQPNDATHMHDDNSNSDLQDDTNTDAAVVDTDTNVDDIVRTYNSHSDGFYTDWLTSRMQATTEHDTFTS